MKAKISKKEEIAEGTLLAEFDLLGQKIKFKAGQYFYITIPKPLYNDKKGSHRHFTIVNPPSEDTVIRMATRLRDSAFKKSLSEMPLKSEVKVGPIEGNFVLPENKEKEVIFLCGGIGITPFISMLKDISDRNLEQKITLFYSNRNQESTAFLDELEEIDKKLDIFKLVLIMTQDENFKGEKRIIDEKLLTDYLKNLNDKYYMISGPPGMVIDMRKMLMKNGVKRGDIKIEEFTGY